MAHTLKLIFDMMGLVSARAERELSARLSGFSKDGVQPVLLHDGTEREIPHPTDSDEQKELYSGKKKRHTVKNAVIITVSCFILFACQIVSGKTHDKKMTDTMYSFPFSCVLYQDTGYQGYAPEGVTIIQPVRKGKGKELSHAEKEFSRGSIPYSGQGGTRYRKAKFIRIVKDECRLITF